MRRLAIKSVLVLLVFSITSMPCYAITDINQFLIGVDFEVGILGDTFVFGATRTHTTLDSWGGFKSADYVGTAAVPGQWAMSYDIHSNDVSYYTGTLRLTNMSNITQSIVLAVDLTNRRNDPVLFDGSVSVTVNDLDGNGSALVSSLNGTPLYVGQRGGETVLHLPTDPFTLSVNVPGGSAVSTYFSGVQVQGNYNNPDGDLGARHVFSLTPGDEVVLNSYLSVVSVPEPVSAVPLGLVATLAGVFVRPRLQ